MLIQINSGQGPKECEYVCYMLYQELLREYPSLKVVSRYVSDQKCLKSITFSIHEDLSYLEGTVQWICQSPFRPHHKRRNWFVDISIIKEELKIENVEDIKFETFRSSGKGGQNVNKVSTAIRAIHIPTGISVVVMDQRSQSQNKKIAYLRLMEKINQVNSSHHKRIDYLNWNKHNQIVRGNPIRVYSGMKFKRIK